MKPLHEFLGEKKHFLAPSLLSADFADLAGALDYIAKKKGDIVHFDIMDGHFVPNLTFGPPVVKALRSHSSLIFDAHLMVTDPVSLVSDFARAGVQMLSVHYEVGFHTHRLLSSIREEGMYAGLVFNPATPVDGLAYLRDVADYVLIMSVNPGFGGQSFLSSQLEKIQQVRRMMGEDFPIQVDGGINAQTLPRAQEAGANIFVTGSAFFKGGEASSLVELIDY